jgi:hypothetical protein
MDKDINRIKVVLAEKKRTNKWLAEQLGKDPATVSKWCTNACVSSVFVKETSLHHWAIIFSVMLTAKINT